MKNLIIYGAGRWGQLAYEYYKNAVNITCFIDRDVSIKGKKVKGIPVYSLDYLINFNKTTDCILIAVKKGWNDIARNIYENYGIENCRRFCITDEPISKNTQHEINNLRKDSIIIEYRSGLGNQMFQYALAENYLGQGLSVKADLSQYGIVEKRVFLLNKIFPNIHIIQSDLIERKYYEEIINCVIEEPSHSERKILNTDIGILNIKKGLVKGYWQSYVYAEQKKQALQYRFAFLNKDDSGLKKLIKKLTMIESVSVHIRRGDYLDVNTNKIFGNICTDEYYETAFKYFLNNKKETIFVFFSNDIEWVREKYSSRFPKAIFISSSMFHDYEDWYDMELMSVCKHNIIANSSFSWWGAWLNQNKEKIVIAPRKWMNDSDLVNICPNDWIRI